MDGWGETEYKTSHDPLSRYNEEVEDEVVRVDGPVIVGAGPSGLAVAACLSKKGIPSVILERSDCIASLWKHKTYDRLSLHLPKKFCELPYMAFPPSFPVYPSKQQFLDYLTAYARWFDITPNFNEAVESAEYDGELGLWKVKTKRARTYLCKWLVVATGENSEVRVPDVEGVEDFKGTVIHTSEYRRGDVFTGKKVLVLGCGNSGMDVCLDLCNHKAYPTLVVRDSVHVLPRDVIGISTFGLAMWLLKWLPVRVVDCLLLIVSRFIIGDTSKLGLRRPQKGPLELKTVCGKTPVLDVGTLAKIESGDVTVRPALKRMTSHGAEFIDGRTENLDAVILATGYRSNVPSWLQERDFFSEKTGLPRRPFPNSWKGERGLYAVGFTQRGILGASTDARRVAEDMEVHWRSAVNPNPSLPSVIPLGVESHLLLKRSGGF